MELSGNIRVNSQDRSKRLVDENRNSTLRRRGILGLFLVAGASMGVVALYQLGIIRRLPDPSIPHFDSEKVTTSAKAYAILGIPDAVLGLGSYAATMALIAICGSEPARKQPLWPIALAAKVGFDASVGVKYAVDEWSENRRLCSWCLAATAATLCALPLALLETRSAFRRVRCSVDRPRSRRPQPHNKNKNL